MPNARDRLATIDGHNVLPDLQVWMEGMTPILRTFSTAQQKEIMQHLLGELAEWWIDEWLPQRFESRYARGKLGYHLRSSHINRKRYYGAPEPLTWTGDTRESVFETARVKTGGSAKKPYADIRMQLGGPRADIVYQVLNTILDGELSGEGVALIESLWAELLEHSMVTGRVQRARKGKRAGDVQSRVLRGGTVNAQAVRRQQGRAERRDDLQADAEDRRIDLLEGRDEGRAKAQAALKRTHDRWRRQSGGAAAYAQSPSRRAAPGMSRTYAGSTRYRRAKAQSRYRRRYQTR